MTDFVSPSPENLASRRQDLRRQRRRRNLQRLWRTTVVLGLAIAGVWSFSHPRWLIQAPEQIVVEGNRHLSDRAIQALLPLDYPLSLLAIEPGALAQVLQAQAPIAEVMVQRQLFPPRLTIELVERDPVAVTRSSKGSPQSDGFLDVEGHWLPQESFTLFEADWSPPELIVDGYSDTYRAQWPGLYTALEASPVKVLRVDWHDPSNLILHTELGQAHMGIYSEPQLAIQLQTLAQLRPLVTANNRFTVNYVDLRDPDNPVIQTPGTSTSLETEASR